MSEIRLHNPELKVDTVINGDIQIVGTDIDDLIEVGMLDSSTIPSTKLSRVISAIIGQLGITWDGNVGFWDPMDRGLGGGIFMSNSWESIE
jgi:hypothetical protein